jgi:serine/threonine-protein kinase
MNSEPFASTIRSCSPPRPPRALSRRTLWLALAGLVFVLLALSSGSKGGARALLEAACWFVPGAALAVVASAAMRRNRGRPALDAATEVERYTLDEKIGEGAMGEIFRAHHGLMGRPTAIKIMRDDGSRNARSRFEREVQLTARLTHPNAISVFDYGRLRDGRLYYAMELLEGMTLEQLVACSGTLPAGRVIHLLLQACGALGEAHALGLVHRDIKPANMYVCSRAGWHDVVKVFDFGLARELAERPAPGTDDSSDEIVGTPLYLSPEAVLMPARVDARADLYALGAVAYFLLCGTPPFGAGTLWGLCAQHMRSAPIPPSQRRLEPLASDLENIVLQCLAKDRAQRPQTALALAELLRNCRDAGSWSDADAARFWRRRAAIEHGWGESAPVWPRLAIRRRRCAASAHDLGSSSSSTECATEMPSARSLTRIV